MLDSRLKKYGSFVLVILLVLSMPENVSAQSDSLKTAKNRSITALPFVFYTPETRLGFGGAGIGTFRFKNNSPSSRPSQVQLGFAYTLNKQFLSYLSFQVFTLEEKHYIFGELGYYRYVYPFYGLGNETELDAKENYSVNFPRIRLSAVQQFWPNTYFGIRYWMDDYRITDRDPEGLLIDNSIVGSEESFVSSLGVVGIYDTRDIIFFPSKGWYIEGALMWSDKFTFGSHRYQRASLDVSKYHSFGKERIWATNFWMDLTFGDVPFQQLAFIGGPKKMRGIIEGRYRDKQLLMLQTEYRFPLIWRFGGVLFAATGQVQERVGGFELIDFHFAYGGGIRFRLNEKEKVHVRLDFGLDEKGTYLFYLTFNEAF